MDRTAGHDDERALAEIERELTAEDPALAAALNTVSPVRRPARWMALTALGGLVLLAGFLLGSPVTAVLGAGGAVAGSLMLLWSTLDQGSGPDQGGRMPMWPV